MLNARKLVEKIKEVDLNIKGDDNLFPYTFVTFLCRDKDWEPTFWRLLDQSNLRQSLKDKLKTWKE